MPNIADILKGVGRVGLNQMLNQAPKPYPDIDPDTGAPTGSHTYKKGTFQPPDQISDFLSEWFGKYLGEEAPPEQVLEYTIHENGINSELNEEELERLTKLVGESYKKHDKLLSQAEFIDKIDGWDLSFVLDLLANPAVIAAAAVYAPPLVPILTTLGGAGLALETIESVPKMAYAIDAGVKLNDYAMMGKLLGLEFLSFLPLVGDLIDMAPLYKNHIDKSIRRYAAKEFEKGN